MSSPAFSAARTRLPEAPAVVAGVRGAVWLTPAGEVETVDLSEAARRLGAGEVPILCHGKAVARRLGMLRFPCHDLLELFAFVRPARFCLPTIEGLAQALLLPVPETPEQEAAALFAAARALLAELTASPGDDGLVVAWTMARGGWPWGPAVLTALGGGDTLPSRQVARGLEVWTRLREWEEAAPEPPPESWPVEAVEARARLVRLLGPGSERRPQQVQYASHAAAAFQPRDRAGEPRVVLAEAGTGVGKTLGYIAPATVWAQKNRGSVWISTYTRNLQRQLDRELDRAYPDLKVKSRKVVVRKGRENVFCLLNYDEAVAGLPARSAIAATALGLVARWAVATRDGDMVGGDFPGWLADLLGRDLTVDLTDTRGECIYTACRHFYKCFIERAIRKARRAEIVVANHALVMVQAARGGDGSNLPLRYVFDEGHHLFEAADSALSLDLTGRETAELRRWLRGAEGGGRSRSRGLSDRIGDLIAEEAEALAATGAVIAAARALPGAGWRQRVFGGTGAGAGESFLTLVHRQVYARGRDVNRAYGLETHVHPPMPGLIEAAAAFEAELEGLATPLTELSQALSTMLDAETCSLEIAARQRIERVIRSLDRRALRPIAGWRSMLRSLAGEPPPEFIDWLSVDRLDGNDIDAGLHRHWVDPMRAFVELVVEPAHGVLITSATLRDGTGDDDADWAAAEIRTGARHLRAPPVLSTVASPFDYPAQTRVLVVTDVDRDDVSRVAAAYRELFVAADGGGLGLFTAIRRLRDVHGRIVGPLDAAGVRLLAQHVDDLDTGTLIDIFRAEDRTCLLGTDAVRDGIDVPGRSLRLIVFDRVPWPRPDILHRARRQAFGGRAYDDMLTRLKLKQAYGRLIRRANDRGVFVMLDAALPTRLTGAFPDGVEVRRLGIRDAIAETRGFLDPVGTGRSRR